MIEQLPTPAMLLDRGLQVRAINHSAAMAFACARSASEVGSVGRLAGCIHAADGACGVRTGCQRCWLSIAVIEAVDHQGWTQARELRLSVSVDGEAQLRIFLLGASPMQLGPDRLALVTLQDVSPKARTTDAERTIAGLTNLDPVELPVVVIDPTLAQMVHANPAADRLLGVSALGLAGDPCRAVDCSAQSGACPVLDLGHECDVSERQLQGEGGHQVLVQVTARPLELDGRRLVVESFQVLTEQRNRERVIKRHNERLEALIELGRRRDEGGEDVLAWALEEVIKLTHSRCGYLYMVDRQQQSLRLDAVHGAKDSEVSTHSERTVSLSEAGVWADALRLLQPVRHNAYPKISVALVAHPAGFRLQRHLSVPVIEGDRVRAVIGVGDKNKKDYDDTDVEQLALFTDTVWELLRRRQAEGRLRRSVANLRLLLRGTTEAITRAVEIRDPYTAGHQRRVSDLARALAHKLGLTGPHVDAIRIAGMLHDIGKIAVPADILTKPSRLTELEFRLLEQHPVQSFEILEHVAMPFPIHTIVRQHHERLDGSGYPDGLKGKAICPEARILAVADVMEAMVSHRPYRPAHSVDDALAELRRQRGVALDKRVVAACIHLFEKDGYNFRE